MRKGTVYQRHTAACPRDADGRRVAHRCRGNWGYVVDGTRGASGARKLVTRSGYPTKRAAQAALQEELARRESGLAEIHDLSLASYLDSWLAGKRRLRDTTKRGYKTHLTKYIRPAIGNQKLVELRPHHIDAFYADLLSGRADSSHRRNTSDC